MEEKSTAGSVCQRSIGIGIGVLLLLAGDDEDGAVSLFNEHLAWNVLTLL